MQDEVLANYNFWKSLRTDHIHIPRTNMIRQKMMGASRSIAFLRQIRLQSLAASTPRVSATGLTKEELQQNPNAAQAPNRRETWTLSQQPRDEAISSNAVRFVQRDLNVQPQPYSAMDLIAKEPVRFIEHGNIAVCDGNKGSTLQGHPKVFINLDQPKPSTCGYCGLRYAKEEFRDLIQKNDEQLR